MTTAEVPFEQTTELALNEKAKLQKSLSGFDLVFFTLCAFVGLDTLGLVAAAGPQGFTWLILLAVLFVFPYALVLAELGSTFTEEGGPYEWVKMSFGRFQGSIAAVFYWVTNPLWVGGSLAFIASDAWASTKLPGLQIGELGTAGDYVFKFLFIWFSIGVAIASLKRGKWIPTAGGFARILVLGFFTITVVIYAIQNGVEGIAFGDLSPSMAVFLGLVPYLLFNYVGFELQNGAAEEMVNPARDVPLSVAKSGAAGVALYVIPILGILLVLPQEKVTGIGGFIDAIRETFTVYGGAQNTLYAITVLGFIFTLLTSGAVWMIGSDRIQAVSAYDGGFFPYFGVFNAKLGTPVRVNTLSGITSTIFMVVAVLMLKSGSAADAFAVVLTIAISTTLISYLWIFPAALKLRYSQPDVKRPYRVPGGTVGIWVATSLITFWVALGSWVAVFPGTLERLFGIDYSFTDSWGVSHLKYEVLTVGTLLVIFAVAVAGYLSGSAVRSRTVVVPLPTEGLVPGPA
jgi:amino acid transporter